MLCLNIKKEPTFPVSNFPLIFPNAQDWINRLYLNQNGFHPSVANKKTVKLQKKI